MADKKQIVVKCRGAELVSYENLHPLQGALKDLSSENYVKLKNEILNLGFSEPFSVWKNEKKIFLLNGHQRHRVIKKMVEDEGYSCPELPVSIVEASSLKEAQKKILALTSQYGQMTKQGLYEFMNDSGLSLDDVANSFRFPEINMADFTMEFFDDGPTVTDKKGAKELGEDEFSEFEHTCPRSGFEFD